MKIASPLQLGIFVFLVIGLAGCARRASSPGPTVHPSGQTQLNDALQRSLNAWAVDTVQVDVLAENLSWKFHYLGPDGQPDTDDDLWTGPDLHIPAGAEIHARISSTDYICTWSVPELAIRRSAVPELFLPFRFQTWKEGKFDVVPDTTCGAGWLLQSRSGKVIVVSRDAFLRWYFYEWLRSRSQPNSPG